MERRNELVGRLFRDGLYLEAVQSYSRDPPRSKEDRALFLGVLQSCLDHVITSSPAHLPAVFEAVFPQFEGDEGVLLVLGRTCLRREMYTEAEQFLLKVWAEHTKTLHIYIHTIALYSCTATHTDKYCVNVAYRSVC